MDQEDAVKIAIIAPIMIISFFLWAYFLSASNVTLQSLIEFENLEKIISSILSFNFIAFLIFLSASYAILVALTKIIPKRLLQATAVASFAVSGIIFYLVFPALQVFLIAGIFYLISLVVVIETGFIKFVETKSFVAPRVTHAAISQGTLILGVGLIISTALFVFPIQSELVENFEENLFSSFTPQDIKEDLAETTSQIIIQTQTGTLDEIISTASYQNLKQKEDSEVRQFVALIESISQKVRSEEYKFELKQNLAAQQENQLENTDFGQVIAKAKDKIPLFSLIEEFFWIFAVIGVVSLFFLASTVIIKPFGIFFGVVFCVIADMAKDTMKGKKESKEPIFPEEMEQKKPQEIEVLERKPEKEKPNN